MCLAWMWHRSIFKRSFCQAVLSGAAMKCSPLDVPEKCSALPAVPACFSVRTNVTISSCQIQSRVCKQDDDASRLQAPFLLTLSSTTPVLQGEDLSELRWIYQVYQIHHQTRCSPQPSVLHDRRASKNNY